MATTPTSRLLMASTALILAGTTIGPSSPALATDAQAANDPATAADGVWPGVGEVDGIELAEVEITAGDESLEGAVVVASLWPSFEVRSGMKVGDTFHLTPIDRLSLINGRGRIHAADEPLLRAHRSGDGTVLVQLDVFTESGWSVRRLERIEDTRGRWLEPGGAALQDEAPGTVYLSLDDQPVAAVSAEIEQSDELVDRHHNAYFSCSAMASSGDVGVPQTVVTSAVRNGIRARVVYTSSASTTSGTGISFDAGASWSQDSRLSRVSTFTATFDTVTGASGSWTNKEWRVLWGHRRWWRHCPGGPGGAEWHEQRFTEPVAAVGSGSIINSRYPLPQCHTRQPLTNFSSVETQSATAQNYGSGFSVKWGPGTFKGTSQSGYTRDVKVIFQTPQPSKYWYWCGDNFYPTLSRKVRSGR